MATSYSEKQVHELFLDTVREYKIMEIINRKPAILNRYDSANFRLFDEQIRTLAPGNSPPNSLKRLIEAFSDCLLRRALSLDARLNNQFGYDNDAASVNMEEADANSKKYIQKLKSFGVSELTDEVLKEAKDPLSLLKITGDSEWRKFRFYMNFLYDKISCWDDTKT